MAPRTFLLLKYPIGTRKNFFEINRQFWASALEKFRHFLLWSKLFLIRNMKAFEDVEVYLQSFFTSALDTSEWSASRPGRFTLTERRSHTHWIGGFLGQELAWTIWRKTSIPRPSKPTTLHLLSTALPRTKIGLIFSTFPLNIREHLSSSSDTICVSHQLIRAPKY